MMRYDRSRAIGFATVVAGSVAANAFAAWTYDSSAMTLSDDSGTVLAVSVVTKYDVTGLQVDSVTSLGTNTDVDFTGFSTPDDGYRVISFNSSAMKGKAITSIVAPDAISCGTSSFQNCASLTNAVFSTSLRGIGASSFLNCYYLDDFYPQTVSNVTSLGGSVFQEAPLKNVSFHFPALTTCGAAVFTFSNPKNLTDFGPVEIVMTNVVTIGNIAMRGRSKTEVDGRMPNLVITSNGAVHQFKDTKIREAYMPKVTLVTTQMFDGCKSLTNAVFSSDLEFIGKYAFSGCPIDINPVLTKKLVTICPYAFQSTATPSIVFDCPKIDCLTNGIFTTCGKTTNVVIKSHVNTLCPSCLTGLAGGVSIWFENGAPSKVATNAITYVLTDRARAKVYVHDADLPSSGFASQLEPVDDTDKTHRGKDVNNDTVYDWPGKRVRGKVKGWYKYGNTFRLSYYYIVGYPLGGILIFR